jgi:hypothetical protein
MAVAFSNKSNYTKRIYGAGGFFNGLLDPKLVPFSKNKLSSIKDFHSLSPQAQDFGLAIGKLRGKVNSGYNAQVAEAADEFRALAMELRKRMKV